MSDRSVVIHRFPLHNPHGENELLLPELAQVCDFGRKGRKFNLWVITNQDALRTSRVFTVRATGQSWRPSEWNYLMTCHDVWGDEPDQHEVWHLLERRKN